MEIPQDCKGCGKCCMLLTSTNTPEIRNYNGDPKLPVLKIYYGRCQYLDDSNECLINDIKPQQCKDLIKGTHRCLESLKSYEINKNKIK